MNLTRQLIESHLVSGDMSPGEEIAIRIDQTLTQDATGTLVMLEFEAMGLPQVRTEISAQYVDHNLLQTDFKNPDDHLFLQSACERFGVHYSRPGNGVSHPVHMERFGRPGKTLLGSDSHSCAAGCLGMLACGAGGLEVALAMAGEPWRVRMPRVFGVYLEGRLPDWGSAKDVILEMLRRHGVSGGVGRVIEYHGPGLQHLTAMDRHVIANMGAELGATGTVFPADDQVRAFLAQQGREEEYVPMSGDTDDFDLEDSIDLSRLEPLIALPSSPGNVVPVREVAGRPIAQAYIGSSANPGLRDMAIPAMMLKGREVASGVSLDINPTSRQILETLIVDGHLHALVRAGARLHQTGCNGCIGMGQAPASGRISLRTVPRNFPGRSGTAEDAVYLCSPETAAASALTGLITDPRDLDMLYPQFTEPTLLAANPAMIPPAAADGTVELVKGPNIKSLPDCEPLPDQVTLPILLKVGDDISTDEIMPAGARVLPFRSNIPAISEFVYCDLDPDYVARTKAQGGDGSIIVSGENYGQGSSREHAALAPRHLGLRIVLAKSYARIHWQNLANFGILPLRFVDPEDYEALSAGDSLRFSGLNDLLDADSATDTITATTSTGDRTYAFTHDLSERQLASIRAGSLIRLVGSR